MERDLTLRSFLFCSNHGDGRFVREQPLGGLLDRACVRRDFRIHFQFVRLNLAGHAPLPGKIRRFRQGVLETERPPGFDEY